MVSSNIIVDRTRSIVPFRSPTKQVDIKMYFSESARRKRIKEAFNISPAALFDKRDDFDKNIDLIEFMFDDTEDDELNICAEKIEHQLEWNKQKSDLLNDGEDNTLCLAFDNYMENNNISKNSKKIPENLLYTVQNTKKEILHNKLVAKIRLIETKKGKNISASFKNEMEDFFYPVECWPNFALEILLSNSFRYQDRLSLATFFYGNGLRDWFMAEKIFKFYNKNWDLSKEWSKRFQEFAALFTYLAQMNTGIGDGPRLKSQYWYYDIESKVTRFFDGRLRTKNGEKRKYVDAFY